jgi:hypothetical protein
VAVVQRARTQRSGTHNHEQSTRKRPHAALRSHTRATARRGAVKHTRQHKSATITKKSRNTAVYNPAQNSADNDAATIHRILQAQHPHHAHADQRRAPRYHHTTPAETHAPPHAHPPQRHVTIMARVTQNSAHIQATHATSHTPTQHTNTQAPHARTTSHTAPTTAHCPNITACTPPHARHTARHTAATTPHTAHRKSHQVTLAASAPHSRQSCQAAQCQRDAAGESVAVQDPAPAGHTNSRRVTPWHPTPPPTATSRPQRIAAHCVNQIKSNESQSAHCMLSLTHSTVSE